MRAHGPKLTNQPTRQRTTHPHNHHLSACGIASGAPAAAVAPVQEAPGFPQANNEGTRANAYARPDGQNVGNFITDRSSSRVLAPPGGGSQITFG